MYCILKQPQGFIKQGDEQKVSFVLSPCMTLNKHGRVSKGCFETLKLLEPWVICMEVTILWSFMLGQIPIGLVI